MPKNRVDSGIIKSSKKRRKVIPFKKKRNFKRMFLISLLLSLVIYTALFTPLFNIKSVEVYGNEKFAAQDMVNMSGISIGINIFKVNYFKVKKNILSSQYIESVKISRHYPNIVRVTVVERKPAAYFEFMGSYLIIDRNGIVLDVQNSLNKLKIPSILGVKFKDYKIGIPININQEDKQKFAIALKCINEIVDRKITEIINKVDVTDASKISIWGFDDKYQLKLTDESNISYNIKFFTEEILPDLENNKSPGEIIDFTIPNKPTVKPR